MDILCVGDEQFHPPTIRDLATFPSLEDAWEDFGRALLIDYQTLQSIKYKFPTSLKRQKELFRTYLKTNLNPNWADIINALVVIGKEAIARQVIDTLELPQELLATARKSINLSASSATGSGSTPASVRVSKTEILASKAVSYSDSDKSMQKSRVVSDDGTISLAEETIEPAAPAVSLRISKTEILMSKDVGGHPLSDFNKPLIKSRVVSNDGATEETDSHFEPSASLPPIERKLKTSRESYSSQTFSDANYPFSSDREFTVDKRSSEISNSLSSDDFHSAEETPLDISEKSTIEDDGLITQSHVCQCCFETNHEKFYDTLNL